MKITDVQARWLRCPIPEERQHVSDFGRISSFDMTLVTIETESGRVGHGEAKAGVGSMGGCASIVACIEHDLKPLLVGQDARQINRLWETMYCGSRAELALQSGRSMPALGRRGLSIAALGAVDMALWDLLGRSLGVPVVTLLGGSCRDSMPVYASGGWADEAGIGSQLRRYVDKGFGAVKMRVGAMDQTVERCIARVRAARDGIGPDVQLMCDAHATMSVSEAKQFCRGVEDCALTWFEEPCSPDNLSGTAEVRASTTIPIALGESEFTRFDIRDAIQAGAVDVVQPDAAIIGGVTESHRIAHLCETHQIALAPHLWGSALSFMAGLHVAFASPAAIILEYALGANPMLTDLVEELISPANGRMTAPKAPGLGVTVRKQFVEEFTVLGPRDA
jgi:L-alanine-DL-glutamate epimerase-like enolase superfamily enzyme